MSARTTQKPFAPDAEPLRGDERSAGACFYEPALAPKERALYRRARLEHGLDGEIALLRLHLYLLLKSRENHAEPAIPQVAARLIDLLIKALRASGTGDNLDRAILDGLLDEESARILTLSGN
jgi:hypothetical protein